MKTTFIFPDGSEKEVEFDSKTIATHPLPSVGKVAHANGKLWFVQREEEATGGLMVYLSERYIADKTDWAKHDEVGQMETGRMKPQHKKWEYMDVPISEHEYFTGLTSFLNKWGADGWEYVMTKAHIITFKREIL